MSNGFIVLIVSHVPIVRRSFIIGAMNGVTQQVTNGFLVRVAREHRWFSEVYLLQSDGGTVLWEENRIYAEKYTLGFGSLY